MDNLDEDLFKMKPARSKHLDKFLQKYKPIETNEDLDKYLKLKTLLGYKVLKKSNIAELVPGSIYIKYLSYNITNKNYASHIMPGGYLISGGIMVDGIYKKIITDKLDTIAHGSEKSNNYKWTHLHLKYKPSFADADGNEINNDFIISIKKSFIFYKKYNDNDTKLNDNDFNRYNFRKFVGDI